MKARLTLTLALLALLILLTLATLPAAPQVEARPMGRTSVEGVWGLAPVAITLTGNQTFTPTGSLYTLSPLSALTMSLATGDALPGDVVVFASLVATTTTITDTGATLTGGNVVITGTGIARFIFNGTSWAQDGQAATY